MEATPLPGGELSGSVLFYTQPEPLNPEAHKTLGVQRTDTPYLIAAKTHMIPLTVAEFQPAAVSYPIIFVGAEYTPVAAMGLRENFNLYITQDGTPDPDIYIPAFIRRYPFVFANDGDRMILCIDRAAPYLVEGGDVPLFDGEEPSAYTKTGMEFCREFETERQRTESFVQLLKDLDLFEVKEAVFTPPGIDGAAGEPQLLAEYYAVSDKKLAELPDEKLIELHKNGALMQIHAHLISLLLWERLVARSILRDPLPANDVAGNA